MRHLYRVVSTLLLTVTPLAAQVTVTAGPVPSGRVTGTAYDSTAKRPLASALVQWASVDGREVRNVTTDARGRFQLDSMVPGAWYVQIAHPRVDSLGLAALTRRVDVRARGTTRAELTLPSTYAILRDRCGIELAGDTLGMLFGAVQPVVRGAGDTITPSVNGQVSVQWRSYRPSVIGPLQELRSASAVLDAEGRYAVCGLPLAVPLEVVAMRGADTTGTLEAELAKESIVRLDLTTGLTRVETISRLRSDSTVDSVYALRGPGRLRGSVVGPIGQPVANARVVVRETAAERRTRSNGTFVLDSLPLGSHVLDVFAIGARPRALIVNITPDGEQGVNVAIDRVQTLDTLRVKAMGYADPNLVRDMIGFEQRRLTGIGAFLTIEDIRKKFPRRFEDVFAGRSDAILSFQGSKEFPIVLRAWEKLRGTGAAAAFCRPDVFVDGNRLRLYDGDFQQGFLNGFRGVEHVVAVEIYEKPWLAPAEFQYQVPPGASDLARCGSVVFWTTQRVPPEKR